jgi:uncharacterized protein
MSSLMPFLLVGAGGFVGANARFLVARLVGATVLRGPMGFGRHSRVHTAKLLELSTDLPVVIEIVDSEEKVDAFLPTVDELVAEGLVTLEAVRVVRYVSPDSRP